MTATTQHRRLQRASLSVALALALSSGGAVANDIALPHWPIVGERSEQMTPLRAKREAWRQHAAQHANAVTRPAATLPVTSCADDGSAGSLRNVLDTAISGDTVDLSALACSTITLTTGALESGADDLRLLGSPTRRLTIDGNAQDRVLLHFATGTLTVENLNIANGFQVSTGTNIGYAGCLGSAGDITLINSNVRNCTAIGVGSYGGAVVAGLLTMRNSTITGNTAFGDHPTNTTASYGGGAFVYGVDILDINSPPYNGPFSANQFTFVNSLDLLRYSALSKASGVIDFTADTRAKYFSIDGGTTAGPGFSTGRNFGDGQQNSHWKDSLGLGIMDPTAGIGELLAIGAIGCVLFATALARFRKTISQMA